jgi:hypothetical protein
MPGSSQLPCTAEIPLMTHDLDQVGLGLEGLNIISYAADSQSQPSDY